MWPWIRVMHCPRASRGAKLDANERHGVALFNEILMEFHEPAFGEEWKLGSGPAERDHTEIPIPLSRSRLQPFNICSRMMFLEKGDYLLPVSVVHGEQKL